MVEFDNLVFNTLLKYFSVLQYKGYVKDADVYKILVIIFINKLLHECSDYITEDDYRKIDNIMSCMYGSSCLISPVKYTVATNLIPTYLQFLASVMSTSSSESTTT